GVVIGIVAVIVVVAAIVAIPRPHADVYARGIEVEPLGLRGDGGSEGRRAGDQAKRKQDFADVTHGCLLSRDNARGPASRPPRKEHIANREQIGYSHFLTSIPAIRLVFRGSNLANRSAI